MNYEFISEFDVKTSSMDRAGAQVIRKELAIVLEVYDLIVIILRD